ncbi:hypothetical protein EDL98_01235 [Ornithobacterium rhinotracheale]|uniref:hypothetical protein n=1 Tax=Ornithobacterium rhinotracheale TaxID=28251 RepID=UPI00129C55B3|nr:hypothetical protein [Ornithobacterium rhinotracheale]MRJ07297.1 hypothetical protein [Ornithobacterium rhinotracheale]MRJ09715.1 hypothetical protein [Ornithobacterium rhinotracheale]UOH77899.1 hypothetical protein MT996_00155 [Ornithobacterium rhinotracheale]
MSELNQVTGDSFLELAEQVEKDRDISLEQAILLIIADEINAMRLELMQLKEKINELSDSATKK